MVTLAAIFEAEKGNRLAVGGDDGIAFRAFAIHNLAGVAACQINSEEIAGKQDCVGVGAARSTEDDGFPIGRPGSRTVVVELALRNLARRSAIGGDHE